ncbi:antA/AntB antirepressor family protein [Clostridium rectalis]|uniref:antA/AntB antirepressor family protein n=1 Tax=Clostridium rectalis TaxID=2040295 RepID=UPI001FAB14DF|nr:antA/AntB antirepressor family protein [Clostridium rectalis]
MKKFSKRFLKEVLGFNEEEVKLTMECQRKFPELLINEAKEIDSARELYLKLGLKETNWSRWSKKNILNNEFFKENIDWKSLFFKTNGDKSRSEGNFAKDFSISIEMAKHLSMMARTENSYRFRQYFILIEKSIRGLQQHNEVREPEKENYNLMKEAIIKDYSSKHNNVTEFDINYLMIRESNMINQNLLGFKANEVRSKLGYVDKETREHLQIKHNKAIDFLQNMIIGLVTAGVIFEERSKIIENICKSQYSDLRMDK